MTLCRSDQLLLLHLLLQLQLLQRYQKPNLLGAKYLLLHKQLELKHLEVYLPLFLHFQRSAQKSFLSHH